MDASKNILKSIQRLKLLKFRNLEQRFIVEGDKLVQEALDNVPNCVKLILVTKKSLLANNEQFKDELYFTSEDELKKISSQKSPQHSIAVIDYHKNNNVDFDNQKIVLACDDIQDPGNFGTMIRTADWFGINTIIASNNTVDVYNQKVIQASMGSIFRVHVEYVNLEHWLSNVTRTKYGAVLGGDSIFNAEFNNEVVIVVGNEGKGISNAVQSKIDKLISIPGFGKAESLNVAVATGIILAEFTKKMN